MPITIPSFRTDVAHVQRLFAYHRWASDQLFGAVASLTADELDERWGGSFGTGRALLRHVVGAERLWVDRWNRRPAPKVPDFPATHSGADFRDEWARVIEDERQFIDALTQDALGAELAYVNIKGEPKSYVLGDILLHVVNHGTYHRGQISHLLRDRGRASPSTDLLLYYDVERSR